LPFVLIAIDNIKRNKGSSSIPGVDRKTLKTIDDALEYVNLIDYKYLQKYRASNIRRIYISKSSGVQRPLGIPTISDRIVQELFRLILDPIIDSNSGPNSYRFRKGRNYVKSLGVLSTFMRQGLYYNNKTILDFDIFSFFNSINKD